MKKFTSKFLGRIASVLMAASMVLLSTPQVALAAGVPSTADTTTVNISGVLGTPTLKAYKVIEADYGTYGVSGYKKLAAITTTISDITALTATEINNLVAEISSSPSHFGSAVTLTGSSGSYSGTIGAGGYLVLATGDTNYIYNPMFVSVQYTDSTDAATLTASGLNIGTTPAYTSGAATLYMKQSSPTVDKVLTNAGSVGNEKGDAAGKGDTVSYKITTKIPSFGAEFVEPVFQITDTFPAELNPLASDSALTVKSGTPGSMTTLASSNYTVNRSGQSFTISFTEAYLRSVAASTPDIEVTYSTTVKDTASAGAGFVAKANDAKIKYSTDPRATGSSRTDITEKDVDPDPKFYSFSLGNVFNKSSVAGSVTAGTNGTVTNTNPVNGASFSLTMLKDEDGNTVSKTYNYTTGTDGIIKFDGLDAGTYKLQETAAPSGYSINNNVLYIKIVPTFDATTGNLTSYQILVGDSEATATTAKFVASSATSISTFSPVEIVDSPTQNLPSTGGTGTKIFYAVGAVLMIAVVAGIIISKKRNKGA